MNRLFDLLFDRSSPLVLNDGVVQNLVADVLSLLLLGFLIGSIYTWIRRRIRIKALNDTARLWVAAHNQFVTDTEYLLHNSLRKSDRSGYLRDLRSLRHHGDSIIKELPARLSKESPAAILLLTEYALLRKRMIALFDCGKFQVGEDEFEANLPGGEALREVYNHFTKFHLIFLQGMAMIEQPIGDHDHLIDRVSKLDNELFDYSLTNKDGKAAMP